MTLREFAYELSVPLVILITLCVLVVLAAGDAPKPKYVIDNRRSAETIAYDWWKTYPHGGGCDAGEAWTEMIDGRVVYFVGKSTGVKGRRERQIVGDRGGFTVLEYRRVWFGRGVSWDDAFFDAGQRGYPPLDSAGEPDQLKENEFRRRAGYNCK